MVALRQGAMPALSAMGAERLLAAGRRQSGFFWAGAAILAVLALIALLADLIAPYPPGAYVGVPVRPPTLAHPMGTNDVGQDVLSALLHGSRVSILVAMAAGSAVVTIALMVALPAGLLRGPVDMALMRVVDVLMAVPHLPLMIVLAAFLGPGLGNVILVIVALGWVRPARTLRSQVLTLRSRGYLHSARLFGGRWLYLTRRHLLPALAPLIAAAFVAQAGRAVMLEAALAFLGIGDPTIHSWGMMMRHALDFRGVFLTPAWQWWLIPPGVCLTLLVMSLMMLGTTVEFFANARLSRHAVGD
jgi:peptide/nickel transport system permease protein